MKVEKLSRKLIKPSTPTPPHLRTYNLSFFDQLAPKKYVNAILYYSPEGVENAERSIQLEKSLSEVLTKFYPLAGRSVLDELLVDCNDQGVDFLEARVSVELDEFLSRGSDTKLLDQLLPYSIGPTDPTVNSLLAVQITNFNCGGLVVGVCVDHIVADACSVSIFVNQWAIASRVGIDKVTSPCLDAAAYLPTRTLPYKPPTPTPTASNGPKFVTKRFVFNVASIQSLKNKVNSHFLARQPSRVLVVTALLWKALICIGQAKHGHLRSSNAIHVMNLRGKTFIPDNTLGNLITSYASQFKARERELDLEDLASLHEESARKLKADLATKLNGDEIYLVWLELLKEAMRNSEFDILIFSSWCRLPFYEADFGWGKPNWVTNSSRDSKVCVLMDTKCGGGIEAWVTLFEEDMIEFERDPDIVAFATCSTNFIIQ